MSIFDDQALFMRSAGQSTGVVDLYRDLICEEAHEFFSTDDNSVEAIKEATDIIVVATGYLIAVLGVDGAKSCWNAVWDSNMVKVSSAVEKREDGKVLKNEAYKTEAKKRLMGTLEKLLRR